MLRSAGILFVRMRCRLLWLCLGTCLPTVAFRCHRRSHRPSFVEDRSGAATAEFQNYLSFVRSPFTSCDTPARAPLELLTTKPQC